MAPNISYIIIIKELTCTLDSGKLIFNATSSLINISGYLVFENKLSSTSNCALVNVVRSRLCFRCEFAF